MKFTTALKEIASFLLSIFKNPLLEYKQDESISGIIENGLRCIDINSETESFSFNIYCGDYLFFKFADKLQHKLTIPELGIKLSLSMEEVEKSFVKIEKKGNYKFFLDGKEGKLTVQSYTRPFYKELTPQEISETIQRISPFILDVRSREEFTNGHLKGAKLIPVGTIRGRLEELKGYENENIIIYCHSGSRAVAAAKILIDNGFNNISNLHHGMMAWKRNDLPVVK